MSPTISRVLCLLLAATPFTRSISVDLGFFVLEIYSYLVFLLLFFFFNTSRKRFAFSLLILICFFFYNCIAFYIVDGAIKTFFKQIIPLIFIYFSVGVFITSDNLNLIFKYYSNIAIFIAIAGIFQLIIYLISGYGIYMDAPPRVNSTVYEASHLAIVLTPAYFYFIVGNGGKMFGRKSGIKIIILLLCIILTQSATGIVILTVGHFLLWLRKNGFGFKKILYFLLIFIPTSMYLVVGGFTSIDKYMKGRLSDTFLVLSGGDIAGINRSTYSLISNIFIAYDAVSSSFLFGASVGGHETFSDKYYLANPEYEHRAINEKSGHSLLIRFISELGVLGFALYVFVLIGMFKSYNIFCRYNENELGAISFGILIYFVSRAFKLGGYFDYGTPLFVILSIVTILLANKLRKIVLSKKLISVNGRCDVKVFPRIG